MKHDTLLGGILWSALIAIAVLTIIAVAARADTVDATGSGLQWSVVLPDNATDVSVTAQCWDCDVRDEATVSVNGGPTTLLFGADDASRDGVVVTMPLPITLAPGANTLRFVCLRRAGCIRIDGIRVQYTLPAVDPLRAWLAAAPPLEVWAVSREDTDPPRVLVCGLDGTRQFAVNLPAEVARLPLDIPPTTECDRRWCFASGPTRATIIREACP